MTARALSPWPPALEGTPAVSALEAAVDEGRLSHGLLLAGDDPEVLAAAALALADRLLSCRGGSSPYPPERHPDCIQVRPSGRSRTITAESVRDLIGRLNISATVGEAKVAVIHDADRLNPASSNILLKTLEEPPAQTTLVLLTARPHALLPTIRSRVLHFRFPGLAAPVPVDGWDAWIRDYRDWLARLAQGVAPGKAAADGVLSAYGLLARFGLLLDRASAAETARRKAALPDGLDDEEIEAIEAEIAAGLRLRMFASVEEATRAHASARLSAGDAEAGRGLAAAVAVMERAAGLLRVNLNVSAALEDFLLASLRIWSRR